MSSAVVIALLCAISTSIGACVGVTIAGIIAAGHEESRCELHRDRGSPINQGESRRAYRAW